MPVHVLWLLYRWENQISVSLSKLPKVTNIVEQVWEHRSDSRTQVFKARKLCYSNFFQDGQHAFLSPFSSMRPPTSSQDIWFTPPSRSYAWSTNHSSNSALVQLQNIGSLLLCHPCPHCHLCSWVYPQARSWPAPTFTLLHLVLLLQPPFLCCPLNVHSSHVLFYTKPTSFLCVESPPEISPDPIISTVISMWMPRKPVFHPNLTAKPQFCSSPPWSHLSRGKRSVSPKWSSRLTPCFFSTQFLLSPSFLVRFLLLLIHPPNICEPSERLHLVPFPFLTANLPPSPAVSSHCFHNTPQRWLFCSFIFFCSVLLKGMLSTCKQNNFGSPFQKGKSEIRNMSLCWRRKLTLN